MACGLPVIATDYPGVRAVVSEGRDGMLAPQGDPTAVAARMREMVELGTQGRAEMGAAGREKAEREWNWPRLLDRMDGAYAEAIEARRAKGRG